MLLLSKSLGPKALTAVDKYLKLKEKTNVNPWWWCWTVWGCYPPRKRSLTPLADKQVRDMTKSQLVKGAFRMLTLKLGQAKVPLIVTNHTYDVIGSYVPTKEMGGGFWLKYAASTIIPTSLRARRKMEKMSSEILSKAKTAKSRLSKENQQVNVRLFYDERGLDRHYGLLELGELGGLWKNVAGRYDIDGTKVPNNLLRPEKYFTPEVFEKLDVVARSIYFLWRLITLGTTTLPKSHFVCLMMFSLVIFVIN